MWRIWYCNVEVIVRGVHCIHVWNACLTNDI
jgi:hypothetical protein